MNLKLSTHLMLIATAIMLAFIGLHEFNYIDINSSPMLVKITIGLVAFLFFLAVYIWQVKEKPLEK